jgi:hypothetical protein
MSGSVISVEPRDVAAPYPKRSMGPLPFRSQLPFTKFNVIY